jgi:hypothetical protein
VPRSHRDVRRLFWNHVAAPFDHNNDSLKVWNPGGLANNTTYYWRIVVKDANGEWTGPQWNFQTVCDLGPGAVTLLLPEDHATDVSVNDDLSWKGGVSQCTGLVSSYDVYFGKTSPPPYHHTSTIKYWDPGVLAKETTYYWKIVAKDAHGSVASEERSFTTVPVPCTAPPTAVVAVSPAAGAEVPLDQDLSWGGGHSQCPGLTATYDVYFGTHRRRRSTTTTEPVKPGIRARCSTTPTITGASWRRTPTDRRPRPSASSRRPAISSRVR